MLRTPFALACSAAATIACASDTVLANGFSQKTCLPAIQHGYDEFMMRWSRKADVYRLYRFVLQNTVYVSGRFRSHRFG